MQGERRRREREGMCSPLHSATYPFGSRKIVATRAHVLRAPKLGRNVVELSRAVQRETMEKLGMVSLFVGHPASPERVTNDEIGCLVFTCPLSARDNDRSSGKQEQRSSR
jgi:hypothetical protein